MNFSNWIPYLQFSGIYSTVLVLVIALVVVCQGKNLHGNGWLLIGYLVYSAAKSIFAYYSSRQGNNLIWSHLTPILDAAILIPLLYPGTRKRALQGICLIVLASLTEYLFGSNVQRFNFTATILSTGLITFSAISRVIHIRDNSENQVYKVPFSFVAIGAAAFYLCSFFVAPFREGLLTISQESFGYILISIATVYWLFFMLPVAIALIRAK